MSVDFIDLQFRGSPHVVATAILPAADGVTLIDPGPTSCLPALERGLRDRGLTLRDVRSLLLTHIHLDHAGASGTIVERVPAVKVYVHERGAPHMIDPAKLLASVTRLWGDQMDSVWGAFLPVPAGQVTVLQGGERLCARRHRDQSRLHSGSRETSRQLSRRALGDGICRGYGGGARGRRLSDRADAATRYRYRSLAGEPQHD